MWEVGYVTYAYLYVDKSELIEFFALIEELENDL